MKKILISTFILLAGFAVMAQPAGGKLFIGGELGASFYSEKYDYGGTTGTDYKETYISALPMAGIFLGDKIAVGIQLGIAMDIDKYPEAELDYEYEKITATTIVINPFFRYYLISGTGGLFAEASFSLGLGSRNNTFVDEAYDYKESSTSIDAGISPGVYYYITPKISIEAKFGWLGYEHDVYKDEDDNKDIYDDIDFNFYPKYLSFGVIFTL